jgi:eukaryotic-like serine/threonine-protein kinase
MARSRSAGTSPGEPTRTDRARGPSLSGPGASGPDARSPAARLLADDEDSAKIEQDEGGVPDNYRPAHDPIPEGERGFGRYTLLRRLAYGGMGEIFLARQGGAGSLSNVAKLVVIKRILSHVRSDDKHRRMFLDEARLQALLTNPHIVQIHDMGEEGGHVFLAMEHVHGPSWRMVVDRCRKNREHIPLALIAEMVAQAARGLSYAHNLVDASGKPLRIVHRDINPHNLLVTYDGGVKIIDFGIAKSELADGNTETGTIKGKFSYMSPEQSAAKALDNRSDIFALGICLYELITLKNPFRRSNIVLSLDSIQRETPPPLDRRRPDATVLQAVVDRCLAKKREDRFDDAHEIAATLDSLVNAGAIPPSPVPLSTWLRERFADEIAAHVSILEQTGSAGALAVRGSDPSSMPRRRPLSGEGERPAPPTGTLVDDDVGPAVRRDLEADARREPSGPHRSDAPRAARGERSSSGPSARPSFGPADGFDPAFPGFSEADDGIEHLHDDTDRSELTEATPPPISGVFEVSSFDEVRPAPSAAPRLVAAALTLLLGAGALALFVLRPAILFDEPPGEAPEAPLVAVTEPGHEPEQHEPPPEPQAAVEPPGPTAEPLPEAGDAAAQAEAKDEEAAAEPAPGAPRPGEPPPLRPADKDEGRTRTPRRPAERQPDKTEKADKPDKPDKAAPAERPPLAGSLVVQSDGYAVRGSRDLPLGGSTTLSITDKDAPYRLTVRVRADASGKASFEVETEPWAILQVNGLGKGRTPLRGLPLAPSETARLELKNPAGQRMSFALTLRPR